VIDRACQSGGECEWHGQAISHANNNIANDFTRREVSFDMEGLGHG
jgi:hypothetical protein